MTETNLLLFVVGLLLFVSVLASSLARFGPPLLLIFLAVGMLAGQDGLGQVDFDNVPLAFFIANLALAIILLDGGLRTHIRTFRVALWPALSLATFGVVVSAALTGIFIATWLDIDWRYGLLLGSTVASTDAAAVFSQLRHSGVALNQRVSATLEIESGTNDPMAIFLVTFLLSTMTSPEGVTINAVITDFVREFAIGTIGGVTLGYALSGLSARLRLVEGLYALLIASGGLMAFTVINQLGGSGFLGIYIVGLVVGNRHNRATEHVFRVMDGLAWLAQAGMFLVLGLLVNPKELFEHGLSAGLIALFLIFVARPIAVWLGLLPFNFPSREQGFIAWVGLRGAVPIVLSLFPLIADLEGARFLFDITFAVVLVSLLVQGTSLTAMARLLKLQVPYQPGPTASFAFDGIRPDPYVLLAFRIQPASRLVAATADRLRRFDGLRCIAVTRAGRLLFPKQGFVFAARDQLYLITPERHREELGRVFRGEDRRGTTPPRRFFGTFTIQADASMQTLAETYDVQLDPAQQELRIADYMRRHLRRRPVIGDVVEIDTLRLAVRTLSNGSIQTVGLQLLDGERRRREPGG